uniref:Uncharacterized protein n=1 Tax=Spongospora subterranea TaxID=70186 RepID=A0A0H5QU86_9EUKA|eukprot:CRZ05578.1 hypothetical protein [Spongospora subterranea]
MNKLQSFADFIGELSSEMLDYANELKSTELSATGEQSLQSEEITDDAEVRRLRSLARGKQRSRLNWFNSSDGKRLRVNIPHHSQRQILPQKRCCLCGNTPGCKRHQSSYKCTFCDVHLCIKVRPPGRKSCWQIWHTKAVLEARGYGERLFPNEHLGDDDDDPAQSSTRRTRQRVA